MEHKANLDKLDLPLHQKKKQQILLIVASVVLAVALLIAAGVAFLNSRKSGTVIVRGKGITDISITLGSSEQYMWVPFVAALQELGYDVSRQDGDIVRITDGHRLFELNLEEQTLFEVGGSDFDFLLPPPGSCGRPPFRKGNDVMLHTDMLRSTLRLMDRGHNLIEIPKLKTVFLS